MPVYDLVCEKCKKVQSDVLLSIKANVAEMDCPYCNQRGLVRKPCQTHARFYGEGFSKTHTKGD
jgi:predicted nucleic acid-binding Zn ribbon protein